MKFTSRHHAIAWLVAAYTALAAATSSSSQQLRLARLHALAQSAPRPPTPAPGLQEIAQLAATLYSPTAPLDTRIMPLCGNGVVNSAADYHAYYATMPSGGWFNLSADFPASARSMAANTQGYTDALFARFRFVADELCDDGNRRDGDGCSADCLEFDALAPPCEIEVTGLSARLLQVIEYPDLRVLGVTADGGVFALGQVEWGGTLNATALVPPSGVAVQAVTYASSTDLVGAGVNGTMIYIQRWVNVWVPTATVPTPAAFALPPPAGGGSYHDILVVADTTNTVVLAVSNTSIAVCCTQWAATAAVAVAATNLGRCTRAGFKLPATGGYVPVVLACDGATVVVDWGSPGSVAATVYPNTPPPSNLLDAALNALVAASTAVAYGIRDATTGFEFDPSQATAATALANTLATMGAIPLATVSKQVVLRSIPGARALLTGSVFFGGSRGLGDAAVLRRLAGLSASGYCSSDGCPLDNITTAFDAFSPTTDAGGAEESLMQALADALPADDANISAPLPGAIAALVQAVVTAPPPRVVVLAARGGPIWGVTAAGKLVQVARNGIVYSSAPGKCWPAAISLLCPKGEWSAGAPCRSCAVAGVTGDEVVAQQLACPQAAASSRRLLQQANTTTTDVAAGIRLPLPASWPSAAYPCVPDAGGAFCVVTVVTADPAGALRNLSAAIAVSGASVSTPPHAVISPPPPAPPAPPSSASNNNSTSSSSSASTTTLTLIIGGVVAGVLVLVVVAVCIWCIVKRRYKHGYENGYESVEADGK